MSTERHQRVEALLQELVAAFVLTEANPNPLITITHVSSSPDYRTATVFFTTIPESRQGDALIFLKRFGGELRDYLKKKSGLKTIPTIQFLIDGEERVRQHTPTTE